MIDDYPEYIIKHRQNEVRDNTRKIGRRDNINHQEKDGETQYYVKWRGFDVMDNTWETEQKIQT